MRPQCESCGMPLKDKVRGTEVDGSLSSKYCAMCYADGAFLQPDATAEQMREYSIKGMREAHWPGFVARWLTRNTDQLPRWQ